MKKIFVAAVILYSLGNFANAQQPDSVKTFVDNALSIMQNNSAFAQNVDWENMKTSVWEMTRDANTYSETAPGISYAFNALQDKHGWLAFGDKEYRYPGFKPDTGRISANIKEAALKGPGIYSAIVDNRYAYISIPYFGGQTNEQMTKFAQRIQDSLCQLLSPSIKGIIIDLRLNAGGNMFPMLAGLSNVLGNDDISISSDSKGVITDRTVIRDNAVIQNGNIITTLQNSCGDLSRHPVAIIIGPVTGSAGECVAAGFIGRKNSILIGEATAGFTTTNNGFLLAGNGYGMVLATGYLTDRFGNLYRENVKPDIEVIAGDDFFHHSNDKKIQAAVKWLDQQK